MSENLRNSRSDERRPVYRARIEDCRGDRCVAAMEALPGDGYLGAALLREGANARPLRLAGPDGFVMPHWSKLGEEGTMLVSRIGFDGKVAWTVDTGFVDLDQAFPGALAIAFTGKALAPANHVGELGLVIIDTNTAKRSAGCSVRTDMRRRVSFTLLLLAAAYVALLMFPQPLFAYRAQAGNLTLYSDAPFDAAAGEAALRLAAAKFAKSPLYRAKPAAAFVCNSTWRRKLLFSYQDGAGGVALPSITSNVFLRAARVNESRLIGRSGNVGPGERTLDYYVAHEIGHVITGEFLGAWRYHRLPQWVREGYADYVGKGGAFNYDEARSAMLADAKELDWRRSGLYTRFSLLCAYLLERRGWTVERLLTAPPPIEQVEAWVRAKR